MLFFIFRILGLGNRALFVDLSRTTLITILVLLLGKYHTSYLFFFCIFFNLLLPTEFLSLPYFQGFEYYLYFFSPVYQSHSTLYSSLMPFSLCYLFRESGLAPNQVCSALGILGIQRGLKLAILQHTLLWRGWQSSAILLLWMVSLEIVSSLGLSRTTLCCLVLCMAMTSSSSVLFSFTHPTPRDSWMSYLADVLFVLSWASRFRLCFNRRTLGLKSL